MKSDKNQPDMNIAFNKTIIKTIPLYFIIIPMLLFNSTSSSASPIHSPATASDTSSILGRWDITLGRDGKSYPSWLEIHLSGFRTLVGRFVGIVGSARPVSRINFKDGKMSFAIPPQWEEGTADLQVEGMFKAGKFKGTMISSNGETYSWTGVKAPILRRKEKPVWGAPLSLFDGKDLSKWHALGKSQWKVESGILRSPHSGANLVTNEKFQDFKLHVEVRYPKGSNSGVYLRGRYEVQVVDSKGMQPSDILFGAIYGFLPPSEIVAKAAGEWQSLDITLVGRMVTVVANGDTIICNREIPGITGGALNSNESDPGPILLQGDHGPVDYRNIIITPAK